MLPYLLLFLAGLGIGYAAISVWKWAALVAPVLLLLLAWVRTGIDGTVMFRFLIGVIITAVGVIAGMAIERRGEEAAAS